MKRLSVHFTHVSPTAEPLRGTKHTRACFRPEVWVSHPIRSEDRHTPLYEFVAFECFSFRFIKLLCAGRFNSPLLNHRLPFLRTNVLFISSDMASDSWAQAVDEQEAAAESVGLNLKLKHNHYRKMNDWIKHFTNYSNSDCVCERKTLQLLCRSDATSLAHYNLNNAV